MTVTAETLAKHILFSDRCEKCPQTQWLKQCHFALFLGGLHLPGGCLCSGSQTAEDTHVVGRPVLLLTGDSPLPGMLRQWAGLAAVGAVLTSLSPAGCQLGAALCSQRPLSSRAWGFYALEPAGHEKRKKVLRS